MSLNLGIIASSRGTAAPPAGLLLDTYPGAAAAYSLRKLRSAYTGAAIRVRRSSDNVEQNIGFVNGNFDSTSLATFLGIHTGFIVTWFDQSGNLNNATTSTPSVNIVVYGSGVPITYNSKPSIKSIGNAFLTASSATGSGNGIQYVSAYIAYNLTALNLVNYLAYEKGTDFGIFAGGTFSTITGFSTAYASSTNETTNNILKLGGCKVNTIPNVYVNGALAGTGTTGAISSFMLLFGGSSNTSQQGHKGGISEMIFYNFDQSSNNTEINNNINTYYTIY